MVQSYRRLEKCRRPPRDCRTHRTCRRRADSCPVSKRRRARCAPDRRGRCRSRRELSARRRSAFSPRRYTLSGRRATLCAHSSCTGYWHRAHCARLPAPISRRRATGRAGTPARPNGSAHRWRRAPAARRRSDATRRRGRKSWPLDPGTRSAYRLRRWRLFPDRSLRRGRNSRLIARLQPHRLCSGPGVKLCSGLPLLLAASAAFTAARPLIFSSQSAVRGAALSFSSFGSRPVTG